MENKEMTEGKARIHAHICGDGSVYTTTCKRPPSDLATHKRKNIMRTDHIIEYWNTCKELLLEVQSDFKKEFNRKAMWKKRGYVKVPSAKWIIVLLQVEKKNSYTWYIPEAIMNSSNNIIINWIRAFFDDEAHVAKNCIRVKSMNNKGLEQVSVLLNRLNIENNITGPNCDKSWYLNIRRENVAKYQEIIGFNHPDKIDKLNQVVKKMG